LKPEVLITLAQLPTPTSGEIGAWLVIAAAVVVMANQGKALFFKQPPNHEVYANRADTMKRFERIEARLDEMEVMTQASERRLLDAGQERAEMLRAEFRASANKRDFRIDALVEKVGELVGELKGRKS
jgi:hypothetical protein